MKKGQLTQFREKKLTEIETEILKLESAIQAKLLEREAGKLKNFSEFRKLKKDLAQLKTISRVKQLLGEVENE